MKKSDTKGNLSVPEFDTARQIPVMEHFFTLQGEGHWAGVPAYFIRLAGCDVGCVWCDVKESWNVSADQLLRIDDLVTAADSSKCGMVVITGGEPAMYDLIPLTIAMRRAGIKVHIETSGAYLLRGEFDWICLSPKKFQPPVPESYDRVDELKIIIFNEHDFEWAEKEAAKCRNSNTLFYLQAEWSRKEKFYPKITEYILKNPRWRMSIQMHKYVSIP